MCLCGKKMVWLQPRPPKSLVNSLSKTAPVESFGLAFFFLFFVRELLEVAAFFGAAALEFFAARRALDKKNVAKFIRAVLVIIVWLAALVAICDDFRADPLAEAFVKNKIFAHKFVFQTLRLDLPGVLDDAAFQLKNIFKTPVFHVRARFFAADAAGAVHHDFFVFFVGQKFGDERQFLPKSGNIGQNGIPKMPHLAFVMVSHVHQNRVRFGSDFVKIGGFQVCSVIGRVKIGVFDAVGHDFWADFDGEREKRFSIVFDGDVQPHVFQKFKSFERGFERLEIGLRHGNLGIDALGGYINPPQNAHFVHQNEQLIPELGRIFDFPIFVKGNGEARLGSLPHFFFQFTPIDAVDECFFHKNFPRFPSAMRMGEGANLRFCNPNFRLGE